MIFRYGRLKHSGHDFNEARKTALLKLHEFIPVQSEVKHSPYGKLKSWLWENSYTRTLLTEAAFAKVCFKRPGGSLYAPLLNIAYIRIPKSASTSICFMMLKSMYKGLPEKKISAEELNFLADAHLRNEIPATPTSEILFTVVRNPFARIVSVYRDFFEKPSGNFIYEDYLFGIFNKQISFQEFVDRLEAIPDMLKDQHIKPQYMFADLYLKKSSNIVILKLEKPQELNSFLSIYGLEMPLLNKSEQDYDYKTYYTPEIYRTVSRIYKKDIQKFQYEEVAKSLKAFLSNKI
jgi:hypothetical protein